MFSLILLISGCKSILPPTPSPEDTSLIRTEEYQKEIDEFLAADAENKKWEKIFLKEIKIAKENADADAYRFFLEEYIKTPRFNVPEWMKKEKGYTDGGWYFIDLNGNIRLE